MSLLDGVLQQLGVVVFVRQDDQHFRLSSSVPGWFNDLYKKSYDDGLIANQQVDIEALGLAFPLIENFMEDADALWKGEGDQIEAVVQSGLWTDIDHDGNEYQLEAKAMKVEGLSVLLIENLTATFADRHAVYQKARDIALINEKLISELNFRQRKLQSEIERHLSCQNSVKELSRSVQRNTSAVLVCLPDGNVEVFNKALVDIYEMKVEDQIVRSSILDKWISEAEVNYPEIHRVLRSGSHWEGEFKTSDASGEERWIRLSIGPIKNDAGDIEHYVCVANDLTDYQRAPDTWDNVGEYDFNTHLPTRRQFWRHIGSAFEANEGAEELVALLYIDIDYFKRINDEFGQFAGDFLLSAIASRISRNIKHRDFVAHLGGDEFVIVLRFVESPEVVLGLAKRLLITIFEPISLDGYPISVTASIGCAVEQIKNTDPRSLLRRADLAMYAAKELGRNQARLYNATMEDDVPRRRQREHEIIEALDHQQFVLAFQPQIAIQSNASSENHNGNLRLEALIRWQHPDQGLIGPDEFIGIAEEAGSIVHIGGWVIKQACDFGMNLLAAGNNVNLAVNISAKQLRHPDFYSSLMEALKESQYPPERLELEITESSFLTDMDQVVDLLKKIRQEGIKIALDDFGSGFSSLNYLKRLPVDYIKIDRSFVLDLPDDTESKAIVTSVIHLAHQLKMEVIAEGVETEQQLAFLREQNVDYIQGYYFYRPMSEDKVKELATSHLKKRE